MFFLGRYGDTFTVWNSPFESKENFRLFTVLSLYLFWFARGVFSLSPFMKQVLRMGNLINFLCSNLQGRLSFALYWFKISKTNSILAGEKGGEYQIDILMCCRHVLRTQNLHKIVVGLSEILNRNWNTSGTCLHLLGSIKEVLYIIYVLLTTSLTLSACLDACLLCSCRLGLHISGEEQKSMGWNQT